MCVCVCVFHTDVAKESEDSKTSCETVKICVVCDFIYLFVVIIKAQMLIHGFSPCSFFSPPRFFFIYMYVKI